MPGKRPSCVLLADRHHDLTEGVHGLLGVPRHLLALVVGQAVTHGSGDRIAAHDGAAYVEVMIPNEESQPTPGAVIDRGYKLQPPRSADAGR